MWNKMNTVKMNPLWTERDKECYVVLGCLLHHVMFLLFAVGQ